MIDDFLPATMVSDLLAHALKNETAFKPTEIMREVDSLSDPRVRQSAQCTEGLGPHEAAFKAVIKAHCEEFFAATGTPSFETAKFELQLIAHGDEAFYLSHIDTHTGSGHMIETNYRVLSCVYYFHHEPKRFSGGEIALFALGASEDVAVIEPVNNRLVVFPSFVYHEVRKISCPSGLFADSRFAINCWIRKDKSKQAVEQGS